MKHELITTKTIIFIKQNLKLVPTPVFDHLSSWKCIVIKYKEYWVLFILLNRYKIYLNLVI